MINWIICKTNIRFSKTTTEDTNIIFISDSNTAQDDDDINAADAGAHLSAHCNFLNEASTSRFIRFKSHRNAAEIVNTSGEAINFTQKTYNILQNKLSGRDL